MSAVGTTMTAWFFTPRGVFLLGVLAIAVANAPHLASPPYWDGIMGVYAQGTWLARNGLDVLGLLSQPPFLQGGPNTNPFLAWAPLFAGLIQVMPPPFPFAVLHALTIGFAALALAAGFAIVAQRTGPRLALLWMLAAAVNPVFSGQAAGIYLEIPTAACFALSLALFDRGRFAAAAVVCLAGWLVKDSMLIAAAAFATFACATLVFGRALRIEAHPPRAARTLALAAPLGFMLLASLAVPSHMNFTLDLGPRLVRLARFAWLCAPEQLVLGVLGIIAAGVWLWRGASAPPTGATDISAQRVRDRGLVLLISILLAGFWLSFLFHDNPLVRYTTLIIVPLAVLLSILTATRQRASSVLAGCLIAFGLANQTGGLLPELPVNQARSGQFLERSREYLADLDANRAAARVLEEHHRNTVIVAKYPFVQMLRLPELGYVNRALPQVVAVGLVPKFAGARPFLGFDTLPPDSLVVFAPTIFEIIWPPSLAPRAVDEIVYSFAGGAEPTVIYRRAARQ